MSNNPISDITVLNIKAMTDFRPEAFKICTTESNGKGILTSFQLVTAADFGDGLEPNNGITIGNG